MTTSGETQAIEEAVTTLSGTATEFSVDGVRGVRAVARGAARWVAEALAVRVHIEDGALAHLAEAVHWVAP